MERVELSDFMDNESHAANVRRLLKNKGLLVCRKGERRTGNQVKVDFICAVTEYFLDDKAGREKFDEFVENEAFDITRSFCVFYEKGDLKIKWADVVVCDEAGGELDVKVDLQCSFKGERKYLSMTDAWFLFDYLYCDRSTRQSHNTSSLGKLRKRYGVDFAVKEKEND